jgi:hypothetical protein
MIRHPLAPAPRRLRIGNAIERAIDLDGVEILREVAEGIKATWLRLGYT